MEDGEVPLLGGQMTGVARVGETVRRTTGPWSPAVHAVLLHLEAVGFDGAPRFLGIDDGGREVLTYLQGEAGFFSAARTVPPDLWSDDVLVEAARLLRRFHDATVGFVLPDGVEWRNGVPAPGLAEVVCHNDFAPYNCVFRDGLPRAMIDLDSVAPGPRAWDLAYAAYSFVPLFADAGCKAAGMTARPDQARRLRLCCDAYGLDDRHGFVALVERRARTVAAIIRAEAAAGDERFQRSVSEGHDRGYDHAADELSEQRGALQAAL